MFGSVPMFVLNTPRGWEQSSNLRSNSVRAAPGEPLALQESSPGPRTGMSGDRGYGGAI